MRVNLSRVEHLVAVVLAATAGHRWIIPVAALAAIGAIGVLARRRPPASSFESGAILQAIGVLDHSPWAEVDHIKV